MLHVIWRRSVLSVSRTLSLVVQCGSFCGRWSKAVSQSRHPVACVCISLGHFKIGKNESTDRQRCHMLSSDLIYSIILFSSWKSVLRPVGETCQAPEVLSTHYMDEVRRDQRVMDHRMDHYRSNCEYVWLPVCHNVSNVYSILFGQFFLQKHTGHGGPLGIQRRAAYPPYSLSQADILGDRMGLNLRRFHKLPRSLSPTFSHYEMMQKEKAKRQTTHKKPIGNIGSDVKVWTFLSSWRIAILHEGRLKCCGEGPQRVCPRLRLDCTWIAHGSSHIHPYPAFDIF